MTQSLDNEGGFHTGCSRELFSAPSKGNTSLLLVNKNYLQLLRFLVIKSQQHFVRSRKQKHDSLSR